MRLGQQQRESILEKGRKLYENRFYRPALELFKKLVDDEPTISILDHCAATNEKLGDLDAALQDAMAMIRLDKHAERVRPVSSRLPSSATHDPRLANNVAGLLAMRNSAREDAEVRARHSRP